EERRVEVRSTSLLARRPGSTHEEGSKMRLNFWSMIFAIGIPSTASAQTTGAGYADALTPSLASVARAMHATIRRDLADAARDMPADEYSFRPTTEVRTFAQVIGHVVNANWFFCSQAKQERPPNTTNHEQLTDKVALVKALNDSLAYCDQAYS